MKRTFPIGMDDFRELREWDKYYVDKSLMIQEFIEMRDKVALIARPRRFGKTLNMTMIREFFDITKDSQAIFEGLNIMDTEYGGQINSKPVLYFSLKDCTGMDSNALRLSLISVLWDEYSRYEELFRAKDLGDRLSIKKFLQSCRKLEESTASLDEIRYYMKDLLHAVSECFDRPALLLLDEYDQPILSSYEHGYREEMTDFFSVFYGSVLKGNTDLDQALLTGIQRVAKESVFSRLNNVQVYTVLDQEYASYFGITETEAAGLLAEVGLELNDGVKQQYDGYRIGGCEMYNPWSLLSYANKGELRNYWINTSTNYLIHQSLEEADEAFQRDFSNLITSGSAEVEASLTTALIERRSNSTLWGLLINAGYITVEEKLEDDYLRVRIPNGEVRSEFQQIVAEQAKIAGGDLRRMLHSLIHGDMEGFRTAYQQIVLSCTSYFDAKENAYHMLFLGMCISLGNLYKVTSNLEGGHGRYDLLLAAKKQDYPHIIIEFKQGEDIESLKTEALEQILKEKYYADLTGRVLCLGIAHDKKKCGLAYREIEV